MKDSCEQIRDDHKQMNKVIQQTFVDIARHEEAMNLLGSRINMRHNSAGAISDLDAVVDQPGTFAVENIASFSMSWDRSEKNSDAGKSDAGSEKSAKMDRLLGKDHNGMDR